MADIRAAQTGNFSATTTWVGGVVPGSGDIAYSNTFTVTVDGTFTVQAVSNASGTSITAGGTFVMANGASLTCTNANGVIQGTTGNCITTTGLTGSATLTAPAINQTASNPPSAIIHSSIGVLTVVANLSSGAFQSPGVGYIVLSGNGTLIINATSITGSTATSGAALQHLIAVTGAGNLTITTSSITGGSYTNGGAAARAIAITSAATVSITGSCTGGTGLAANAAVSVTGGCALTINGTCTAGSAAPAVYQTMSTSGVPSDVIRLSGPLLLGASNIFPVLAHAWRWLQNRAPTYMQVRNWNSTQYDNLYTSDGQPTGGYPTAANVLNTAPAYGDAAQYTGTYVPVAASSVAAGVVYGPPSAPLTGTAVLTAATLRSALGMASANLDTQLSNKATVDQVASIVQGATSA